MKKFMNKAENYVDEMLQGILVGNPDDLRITDDDIRCIVRKNAGEKKKVALAWPPAAIYGICRPGDVGRLLSGGCFSISEC